MNYQVLSSLIHPQEGQASSWVKLRSAAKSMEKVIHKLGAFLDDVHAQDYEGLPRQDEDAANRRVGPPKELETTMRLLKGCTSGMISGQWSPLEVMMHKALDDEAPRLMTHLQMYAALNPGTEAVAERLRTGALERLQSAERSLEALLPEVDLILIRVQSCFDYEVSVSK
jgi:hypothetical protein